MATRSHRTWITSPPQLQGTNCAHFERFRSLAPGAGRAEGCPCAGTVVHGPCVLRHLRCTQEICGQSRETTLPVRSRLSSQSRTFPGQVLLLGAVSRTVSGRGSDQLLNSNNGPILIRKTAVELLQLLQHLVAPRLQPGQSFQNAVRAENVDALLEAVRQSESDRSGVATLRALADSSV